MPPSGSASEDHVAFFHAASVDLLIPEISSFPSQPTEDVAGWWKEVERVPSRTIAFLGAQHLWRRHSRIDDVWTDEKLFYLVALRIPDDALPNRPGTSTPNATHPPSAPLRFLDRIQVRLRA